MSNAPSPAPVDTAPRTAMGLRARLLLILIPVLVALFAFDSWSDTAALGKELEKAYDQTLLEPAQALSDSLAWGENNEVVLTDSFHISSMFESLSARSKHMRVIVESADGKTTQRVLGAGQFPEPPAIENTRGVNVPFRKAGDDARVFYNASFEDHPIRVGALLRVIHDPNGHAWTALIQTARSTNAIDTAKHELLVQTLFRDARTLGILVLIIWLGIAWGLRPLNALRAAIGDRKSGDLAQLQTSAVPGEVRPLVNALNLHLAQQREALDAQRQFLTDASHQLRTPLAIMHTQTGYALRETDPDAIRSTLQGILQQLQRSRRVSEQLLSLAQAHQTLNAQSDRSEDICDVNAVARDVVIAYLSQAGEKQIDLGWLDARGTDFEDEDSDASSAPIAPARASPLMVHEVLSNLVHNAIAYTPCGAKVSVSVQVADVDGYVTVQVQDNGPGIAPIDRLKAFERFQRLGSSDAVPGSGLGLAIARTYVLQMHGSIELLDGEEPGKGLTVRVRLPRVNENN